MVAKSVKGLTMMDDEQVLHDVHPSWANWFWTIVIGICSAIVLVGFLLLFHVWRSRRKTRYIVTTERVVHKKSSLLSRKTREYPIRDIAQLQTGSKRLSFGTGHVQFSVGGGGEMVTLGGIRNTETIANAIRQQQRRLAE